ncbi:MAG: response regulator transcription factor [Cellvibrionales bacterium]|nr:response regulator transcription factor [Cellvibrionales bacterium]
MLSICLIDDHPLFRDCLTLLLKSAGHEVIAEFDDCIHLEQKSVIKRADMLIFDYKMPGDPLACIKKIKSQYPEKKCIVLTGVTAVATLHAINDSCVDALVLKENSTEELLQAIALISEGKRFTSGLVMTKINRSKDVLSSRELEVLPYLIKGVKRAEIAQRLFISTETIKTHRRNILQKLNANNIEELREQALILGLIEE